MTKAPVCTCVYLSADKDQNMQHLYLGLFQWQNQYSLDNRPIYRSLDHSTYLYHMSEKWYIGPWIQSMRFFLAASSNADVAEMIESSSWQVTLANGKLEKTTPLQVFCSVKCPEFTATGAPTHLPTVRPTTPTKRPTLVGHTMAPTQKQMVVHTQAKFQLHGAGPFQRWKKKKPLPNFKIPQALADAIAGGKAYVNAEPDLHKTSLWDHFSRSDSTVADDV